MKNKDLSGKQNPKAAANNLEWGAHNPRLSERNFIDRKCKKISDQNELLAGVPTPPNQQRKEK